MDPNRRSVILAALLVSGLGACTKDTARTSPSTPAPTPSGSTSTAGSATTATPGGTARPPATSSQSPTITEVATGLSAPWSITFHGTTALVSERDSGRVLAISAVPLAVDATPGTPVAPRQIGTVTGVVHAGEGGLLGLAVRQDALYAYFTAADDNRIVRYSLTGTGPSLSLSNPTVILAGIRKAFTHNGGRIAFGPDGMLYATVGDAGARASAQDRGALNGKILRMTPDGEVPDDNPFPGSLVYSFGHRNPQGLAWAPDGTLFASEFGQNTWDELNIIRPGANYGWPTVEGIAHRSGLVDPVQQWTPDQASPSGIAITGDSGSDDTDRGAAIWIANLKGNRLRRVPVRDPGRSSEMLVGEFGRLRDVVVAPDGHLWVLTNNTDGRGSPRPGDDRILRIDPAHPPSG
ncbi:PQQ-dependent sugar dehydrogenase [Aestuariimicrobium kwangyangense]|uniref:PQQ-dependent sugar dehydrogenase n=1 Tax=Aestuariimicrobium kwangyangense TaxID=396389 RepID=UPI0003B5C3D8|nr:PQQ-dependent sugar dehydrogenase [Aestuariimicrobium kwangyangense]